MIKTDITVPIGYKAEDLKLALTQSLPIREGEIRDLSILRRRIDLKDKSNIVYKMTVGVALSEEREAGLLKMRKKVFAVDDYTLSVEKASFAVRPIVVGFGPCGMFVINLIRKNAFDFRKKMWKQVELTEEIYTTMSVGLFRLYMAEDKKKIIKINPKTLELFDVDNTEEFLHRYVNQIVDETNEQAMKVFLGECDKLKKQWDSESVECNVIWKDGTVHLLKLRNTLVEFDENAKIIQCLCQDITEERKLQQLNLMKVEEKATLDPMTQIKNKKAIEEAIRENIKLAGENKQSVAVGFVDIDNFKDYNTKYGHLQGDEVIKHVAYILRDNIKGIVGRNGGDEFSFCMLNVSEQNVEEIMQYVYEKLNEGLPLLESGEMISTPCSIGIVLTNREDVEYGYVIEEADKAMYYAKERGKNTYHILKI